MVDFGRVIKTSILQIGFALFMITASCTTVFWQSFTIKQQKKLDITNINNIAKEDLDRTIIIYNEMLENIGNRIAKKENHDSIASLLKQFYINKPGSKIDFKDIYWYGTDNKAINRYGAPTNKIASLNSTDMPNSYLLSSKTHEDNKLYLTTKVFANDKTYIGRLFVDLDIASWLKSLKLRNPEYSIVLLNHEQAELFRTNGSLENALAHFISQETKDVIFNHSMQFSDPPYMLLYGYSTTPFYNELVKSTLPLLSMLWGLGIILMVYQRFYNKALKSSIEKRFLDKIDTLALENAKSAETIKLSTIQSVQDREEIKGYKDLMRANKIAKKERHKLELMLNNKIADDLTDIKEIARVLIQAQEGSLNVYINDEKQIELMGVIHNKLSYLSSCCVVFDCGEIRDLKQVIDDTLTIYAEEILVSKLAIQVDVKSKNKNLFADELLLRQLLANLLHESISCSKPGGKIHISALIKEGDLLIKIQDDGFGISEEIGGLVEVRKQLSPLNLDMQTIKEIVESLHGSLSTQYVIGKGKTISLTLPTKPTNNNFDRGSDAALLHIH